MTPLEINNKISEIKGIETSQAGMHIPDWANKFTDAFELLAEMLEKMPDFFCIERTLGGYEIEVFPKIIYGRLFFKASTAPMVICLAWLSWKGFPEEV